MATLQKLERKVAYVVECQVEEHAMAARVMLYFYRCILKGPLPFELASDDLHQHESDPRFGYTLAQLENNELMVPDTATSPVLAIEGTDASYSLKVAKSHDRKHKKSKPL